jgi:L-gulonolactone oxidase
VGFAHSWAGLYIPVDNNGGQWGVTVVLHHLTGITQLLGNHSCFTMMTSWDAEEITHIEVMTGTSFAQLYQQLDDMHLALSWQSGGIQGLTVGGAISVGFHGSQRSSSSISSVVQSLTVYDTKGQVHILDDNHHRPLMMAARLGLGVCGVLTRAILPVKPRFYLRRRRWVEYDIPFFLSQNLTPLKSNHDRFHYYIHPYSRTVWPMYWENASQRECFHEARPCRTAQDQWEDEQEKDYGQDGLPLIMRWDNCCDISYKAYTHAIDMEAQPLWNGEWFVRLSDKEEADTVLAILEIFNRIADPPDIDVWLHIRYMRGDDIYLHPCYGWDYCAGFELALVAKGMEESLPSSETWYRYYHPFEQYLQSKGGRPHWAKDHTLDPEYIARSGLPVTSFLEQCRMLNIGNQQGNHAELVSM